MDEPSLLQRPVVIVHGSSSEKVARSEQNTWILLSHATLDGCLADKGLGGCVIRRIVLLRITPHVDVQHICFQQPSDAFQLQ